MGKTALSHRLSVVAGMAPAGYTVADIGCDHGLLAIYLAQKGISGRVYAADVRRRPLEKARENIARAGLSHLVFPVLSDGLRQIPVEGCPDGFRESPGFECPGGGGDGGPRAQGMVAAGIGGPLMVRILGDGRPRKSTFLRWMVLEPQSRPREVRQWLSENGFYIVREQMVKEHGKFYPVLLAVNGTHPDATCESLLQAAKERREAGQELWKKQVPPEGRARADFWSPERFARACGEFGIGAAEPDTAVLEEYLRHVIRICASLEKQIPAAESPAERDAAAGTESFAGREAVAGTKSFAGREAAGLSLRGWQLYDLRTLACQSLLWLEKRSEGAQTGGGGSR